MLQRMKRYTLAEPTITRDEYNEEIISYDSVGFVDMFISFLAINQQGANDVRFNDCTHIGLTKALLTKGMLIDGKYEVMYTLESSPWNRAYLKEIEYV